MGDVSTSNRNVFNGRADDISFGLKDVRLFDFPTTGITCVTPSPLSITVPVRVCSVFPDVQDAARAKTA